MPLTELPPHAGLTPPAYPAILETQRNVLQGEKTRIADLTTAPAPDPVRKSKKVARASDEAAGGAHEGHYSAF